MKKVMGKNSGSVICYSTRRQGQYISFRAESESEIEIDDAKTIQEREEGRLIVGYSFEDFRVEKENGMFIASWMCLASCD